jgi:hypothetical protein
MIRLNIHIVKFSAVVISLIYILIPLHNELKSALHGMSHYLEMPDVVLSHNQNENLNYKTSTNSFHGHKIIDLLDYLAEATNNNEDSNKANLVDNKIDKHFYSSKYKVLKLGFTKSTLVFDNYIEKLKEGFYEKIIDPPKAPILQLS